jgi:hypothetical protein
MLVLVAHFPPSTCIFGATILKRPLNKVTAWIRIYKIVFHIKNDRNALYARTRSSMQCSHNERYYIMADAKFADATCS